MRDAPRNFRRVVHQRPVLDRIRAGKNRAADGLGGVRVNRHRFSGFVCFVHCGFHLLERICRTAAGTAAQGAENLDDIIKHIKFPPQPRRGVYTLFPLDSTTRVDYRPPQTPVDQIKDIKPTMVGGRIVYDAAEAR